MIKTITNEHGETRTVSEMHDTLMGRTVKLPVATGVIEDTTETASGQVYVSVTPRAIADTFNCVGWIKLEEVVFIAG